MTMKNVKRESSPPKVPSTMEYERRLEAAAKIILEKEAKSPPDCTEFGVTATLKPHQVEGVSWLIQKYLLGVNVVLGGSSNPFLMYKFSIIRLR